MHSSILVVKGSISDFLKRLQAAYQPTPGALARAVGMSYTACLKIERGQRELSFLMALRICRFYKLDLYDFVSQLSDDELERSELFIQKQYQKRKAKKAQAAKVIHL